MKSSTSHFAVCKLPGRSDEIACFSVDSARPDEYVEALQSELCKKHFKGVVLLDLLASNGDTRRRFMRVSFDGVRLNWLGAKIASRESIDPSILQFCQAFYHRHSEALERSVLSKAAQHRILSDQHLVSFA